MKPEESATTDAVESEGPTQILESLRRAALSFAIVYVVATLVLEIVEPQGEWFTTPMMMTGVACWGVSQLPIFTPKAQEWFDVGAGVAVAVVVLVLSA